MKLLGTIIQKTLLKCQSYDQYAHFLLVLANLCPAQF